MQHEIQVKTDIIKTQSCSGIDAQRLNSQRLELKNKLIQLDKELCSINDDLVAESQLFNQEKAQVCVLSTISHDSNSSL